MAYFHSPRIVTNGLIFYLDSANPKSYISGSSVAYSPIRSTLYNTPLSCSLVNGVGYFNNNLGHFTFDGVNDQILIENTPTQNTGIRLGDGTTYWMVNAWVKTTTGNSSLGQSSILSNRSGGPVSCLMGVGTGGVMKYQHYSGSWFLKTGSLIVNDNKWHMLSWLNLGNSTMDMYVDGIFDINVSSSTPGVNPVDIIGASWSTSFNGSIASISIHIGEVYTQFDVIQNYNATKGRFQL